MTVKINSLAFSPSGPVLVGFPLSRVGRERGFLLPNIMDEELLEGTMPYYRKKAETDPEVADLIKMIDHLTDQLLKALSATIRK